MKGEGKGAQEGGWKGGREEELKETRLTAPVSSLREGILPLIKLYIHEQANIITCTSFKLT